MDSSQTCPYKLIDSYPGVFMAGALSKNDEKNCLFLQGSKGIRQWMYKLMYIPNDDTQSYPFCNVKLVVETFEHST